MSATPDNTLADPQQIIADLRRANAELQRRLDESNAETRQALDQQTATAEILQVINSSPGDLNPVFDAMLEKALRLCDASFGILFIRDRKLFRVVATRNLPSRLEGVLAEPFEPSPGGFLQQAIGGEAFEHIADLRAATSRASQDPRAKAMVELGDARTVLSVALCKDHAVLGSFGVYRTEVRPFTDKQIALVQNFAAQAVIAMENARLITETREALEQQTATAEVLGVINSSPGNLAPVFDAILEKALRLCGADFGVMNTFDGEHFQHAADRGVPAAFAEYRRRRGPMVYGSGTGPTRLVAGENLVHAADLMATEVYQRGDPDRRALVDLGGARSSFAVALRKDDTLLGMITIYRQEVRPFTDKEIALLESFAAQAVIAMENARLITETREALEQQTATAEILGVINSSPGDLGPVFDAILEKALRLCEADLGTFWTYDGDSFAVVSLRGAPPEHAEFLTSQRHRPGPGTIHALLLGGEAVVHIADARDTDAYRAAEPTRRRSVDAAGARTVLAVSLRKGDQLLGLINIYRREVRPFTEKQIALLQNFAAQAVIAMENARLITETREALEQQTATAEVLGVINSSPGDLAPVFDAILEKAMKLCGAAFGLLRTIDGEIINTSAHRGAPDALLDILMETGRTSLVVAVGELIRGQPFVQELDARDFNAYRGGNPIRRALADLGGARTILWVPLRKDEALLGFFALYRKEVRPFSEKQIVLLQNFAAQAVIAMENARLLGELRQRTDEVGELNRDLEARVAAQVDELGRVGRLKRFLAPQLAELIVSHGDEKILESHRREIVVVFCDLRGYTAFTETAEPEEVLDFLRQYHGALGPLVSQFEGTLDQFSGDGIMVFFNDPVPCPDPAERAVKMAVAMRSAANTLIADWRERGRDLGFGAGIAQGYATLGQIGFSERAGYTAIGTVCNIAARLCAEAKDGQILLGQRVNVALKGSVATEQLGALTLKGLTQPVAAYNVPLGAIQPALRVIEGGSPQTV